MTVYTSSQVASNHNVSIPPVADVIVNSPAFLMQSSVGRETVKDNHAIDGNGAQADNIYQVTGVVLVHLIEFHIDIATDSAAFSNVKLALYDGTATLDITTTVNGSGCIAGDYFYKRGLLTTPLIHLDTSVGVLSEASSNKVSFEPFFAGKKSAALTYIQLLFTGDANTDIVADFEAYWNPVTHDGNLVAV